jgi:lipoprotein-releasing system ATP-binding protein
MASSSPMGTGLVPLVRARQIVKDFAMPGGALHVLKGCEIDVMPGQILAILGASGVGKSTFLHILGTLERPTSGSVEFAEGDVFNLTEGARAQFRNRHVGFVFQFHHLMPEFTAVENVMMPALVGKIPAGKAREMARSLLAQVGMSPREGHKPHELSGGEQQRVAVARSLINEPRMVIADEPSGNLDPETAEQLHRLVYTLARDHGQSWVIATHNESLASIADTRIRLVQGRLQVEPTGVAPAPVAPGRRE